MLMVTLATMAGTVYLYVVIPKGFFPVEDTASSRSRSRGRPTSRSAPCASASAQIAEIIRKDPAVAYVNSTVGVGGPNSDQQYRPHVRRAQAEEGARTAPDR